MQAFKRRNTMENIEINGHKWEINWARDAVNIALLTASVDMPEFNGKSVAQYIEDTKKVYRAAINDIIGDPNASNIIFADDDSIAFTEDVYSYLTEGYRAFRASHAAQYSPERAAQK